MNPDQLEGRQICASSSNRNFKGRQGSPTGRTLLMSPAMVAAAAMAGEVVDVRHAGLGARSHGMSGASRIRSRRPAAGCRCAATTSTPIASCRRASCAVVTFEGSSSICSRTTATPTARRTRSTTPRYTGARILVVNANFGCGSSREHAPQGLLRWGIRAIVGEGYSEIFFGNSVTIGLPCLTVSPEELEQLMKRVEADPATALTVDVERLRVAAGDGTMSATMPRSAHEALITGLWDGSVAARGFRSGSPACGQPSVRHRPLVTNWGRDKFHFLPPHLWGKK